MSLSSAEQRVERICRHVAAAPEEKWTTARMAGLDGTSVTQVQRAFRSVLGIAPRDFAAACRQRRFLAALKRGTPVTDALYEAGFGSSSRAYESFRQPGMTPATYGRGGEGAVIRWITVRSVVGLLLVATTDRGVCFVEIGPDSRALLDTLRAEFPRAVIGARASRTLRAIGAAARAVADARPSQTSLPVDIRGTAFQWRVWRALMRIPAGETRSYGQVAEAIGAPSAVRAVARACATNPVALLIPCHRVVGHGGDLRGYRWGIDVKRRLLDAERQVDAVPGQGRPRRRR